jgi:eukaryotic-like serine/threonine-protein kinase
MMADEDPEISMSELERWGDDPVEDAAPITGERFGKYLLVGELGLGGMAEVFLAVQHGLEGFVKVVTLKRVLPHLSESPDFVEMFVDEARLAARLEHPNIVRTYEFGEHEGQYYTVMEYLAGEDLGSTMNRAAMSRQAVPLNTAAHIVAQLCCGLHFAHELTDTSGRPLGLVHRDINPSNVIVTYAGEVKIIDFGVAKSAANSNRTISGTIKGKLAYMSPEQVLARGIDRRSDVFSLGVVLWELVAGRPLFTRDSDAATLYSIMNDPIPRVGRYRAGVPEELEALIATALSRTPVDRFTSAEEMQLALETFLATQPKLDARGLARSIESLFGSTRAHAKRSIAQTRALTKNASLVMKLRSEVRAGLTPPSPVPRSTRGLGIAAVMIALAVVAGGLGYLGLRGAGGQAQAQPPPAARASLELTSAPTGAAIFIGGEPTGLTTPATLSELEPGEVAIRVELAGRLSEARVFHLSAGGRVRHTFSLGASSGRLAIAGLPSGSVIEVAGDEHAAGEVITLAAGRHEIRIVADGATLVHQTIEVGSGHQVWELRDRELVRR